MKKKVYFNSKQIEFASAHQLVKVLIGGRAFGKSTLIALILYFAMRAMPGGKWFLAALTFEQIEDNTLASIREKWLEMGLVEGVDFVIGIKPPPHFKRCKSPIKNFEHSIVFKNGFTIKFISMTGANRRRGGTYDGGIIDEAAFVKEDYVEDVLIASIRGNIGVWKSAMHQALYILSSRPNSPEGRWVYKYKKVAEDKPEEVLYMETSALDNWHVLTNNGEVDWFARKKETMSPSKFALEILNIDMTRVEGGFYHSFSRNRHTYAPQYDPIRERMTDVRSQQLLEVSFDFGGKFNCCLLLQEHDGREWVKRAYYAEGDRKFKDLVDDICREFATHQNKYVRIWGEPRGKDRNAFDKDDQYLMIKKRFASYGWVAEVKVKAGYQASLHRKRYGFMNGVFNGDWKNIPVPSFNSLACKDVMIAIESTAILPDNTKDKRMEKKDGYPQIHAPHFTDCLDNFYEQKHSHKAKSNKSKYQAGEIW